MKNCKSQQDEQLCSSAFFFIWNQFSSCNSAPQASTGASLGPDDVLIS